MYGVVAVNEVQTSRKIQDFAPPSGHPAAALRSSTRPLCKQQSKIGAIHQAVAVQVCIAALAGAPRAQQHAQVCAVHLPVLV